ncbi:MAG: DNA-binding protein [Cyclobacteriaceae bacterium]|nr:DNA-binding protein [Cyclobacteriaceae bacterium]
MKTYLVLIFFLLISLKSMPQVVSSNGKYFAFRLGPHEDIKKSILKFAKDSKIKAGCIVSAVGSLEQLNIRFANQESAQKKKGHFEIVSLTGTFSDTSSHIHLSVSDSTGITTGGHLMEDNLIYTTLEIIIVELTEVEFTKEKDITYGYSELVIKPRSKQK